MNKWARRFRKLATHPRPLRFVAGRLLWLAGVSERFVIQTPRGFRMRFYPSSISAALWADPESRREDEDFVWAVLRPGDRYVDVGANVGQLALAAAMRVGAGGSALAIEAHPNIHRFLEGNLALNDVRNVETLHCAVGATRGEVGMTTRRSDDQNYISPGEGVRVPMRPLDEITGMEPIRLLKLDVEGYELPALQGAAKSLAQTEVVYCELSGSNCARFGYEPAAVEDLLLDAGFVFLRWEGRRGPVVSDTAYFATLSPDVLPATGYNLVAVRPEGADDLARTLQSAAWSPP